jgi:DNA mismatch endonuclease (patch repair protein)
MVDVHTRAVRSYNMSRIRGKNTKPELMVRSALHANGFRFRLNDAKLPGKPDIVLPKHRTLIFVNGCFWHGHSGCRYFVIPGTRTQWWLNKISGNKRNDIAKQKQLRKLGWRVIVLWECRLRPGKRDRTFLKLIETLR